MFDLNWVPWLWPRDWLRKLARHAGVPVWNGLTEVSLLWAVFMTIEEHVGKLKGTKLHLLAMVVSMWRTSLMIGSAIMGLDFRIFGASWIASCIQALLIKQITARSSHARITITDNFEEACAVPMRSYGMSGLKRRTKNEPRLVPSCHRDDGPG